MEFGGGGRYGLQCEHCATLRKLLLEYGWSTEQWETLGTTGEGWFLTSFRMAAALMGDARKRSWGDSKHVHNNHSNTYSKGSGNNRRRICISLGTLIPGEDGGERQHFGRRQGKKREGAARGEDEEEVSQGRKN